MLPGARTGLKDCEVRYRQRYLDLICNSHITTVFYRRSMVINYVRCSSRRPKFRHFLTRNSVPPGATSTPAAFWKWRPP